MRSIRRAVTAVATAAALTVAGAGLATPAHADPTDGKGCVGLPTVPVTYVCVISVTPTNALPTTTTTSIPVAVPQICYFLDCTDPTTVNVPVPGVSEGSGQVAVIYHNGVYYPIGIGSSGIIATVNDVVDLGVGVAGLALSTIFDVERLVVDTAGPTIDSVFATADDLSTRVGYALDDLNYVGDNGVCNTARYVISDLTRKSISSTVCRTIDGLIPQS
jgi:hypothetical protein